MIKQYAIIILAAGASRRLGQAKQLVQYKGSSLVNNTIEIAKQIKSAEVFVILGASANDIFLQMTEATCFINDQWEEGMGNTISFAMQAIPTKNYRGIVLVTCDQPQLSISILKAIILKHQQTKKGIIVSKYNEGQGIPSFFSPKYFHHLARLKGDNGAKRIVKMNKEDLDYISFPEGDFDIDTVQDLNKLHSN